MTAAASGLRVGVVGATGYAGSESLRWLAQHPDVAEVVAVSRSQEGVPVGAAIPALQGLIPGVLHNFDAGLLAGLDAVFLATPHGAAKALVEELDSAGAPLIFDLSADHRHAEGFVYGLAEHVAMRGASRVAVPGCFATALNMALVPLARAGVLGASVHVAAATGSTGAGVSPARGTHHPERFANLKAYKVLNHQHVPEVLACLAGFGASPELLFVPQSAPLDRGIFATIFAPLTADCDVRALFTEAYGQAPLVRLREESPELRHVRGTAFCDISVHQQGQTAVILVAIDNLGKGAAAQAVQCFNLVRGAAIDRGLRAFPATP